MTANSLKRYSLKDLTALAKKQGLRNWQSMNKDQLIKALTGKAKALAPQSKSHAKPSAKRPVARAKATAKAVSKAPQAAARSAQVVRASNGSAGTKLAAKPASAARSSQGSSKLGSSSQGSSSRGSVQSRVTASSRAVPAARAITPSRAVTPNRAAVVSNGSTGRPHATASHSPAGTHSLPSTDKRGPQPASVPAKRRLSPEEQAKRNRVIRRIEAARAKWQNRKDLASAGKNGTHVAKDRLVAMVRDPFWLHCCWELSRQGVDRAQAALGQDWHLCRPVLRLLEIVDPNLSGAAEMFVRDIEIHGGVNNWYVDVIDPPKSYRLEVGYRAQSGRFFSLARSNIVTTPKAGASDAIDENWQDVAENFEKVYALSGGNQEVGSELQELFEERLRRPMNKSVVGVGAIAADTVLGSRKRPFCFELEAELILFGQTEPGTRVTLQNDPVKLRDDGTFTVRFSMPNARQVIPAVAISPDGLESRTVVLAVERNTKVMEPVVRDNAD